MGYESALEAALTLGQAYYYKRDVNELLNCVTDDIMWVGSEENEFAQGKEDLESLLLEDVKNFPGSIDIEFDKPIVNQMSDHFATLYLNAHQVAVANVICGMKIRATISCRRFPSGWLVSSLHVSVPNSAVEKYSLAIELDDTRKKQDILLSSIPGGAAIYRIKKSGRIVVDYVSPGLAKMFKYDAEEFLERIGRDALADVLDDDVEKVRNHVISCLINKRTIHVHFREYTKDGDIIRLRCDGSIISGENKLPDDIATVYAVLTRVTKESEMIVHEQKRYREILSKLNIAFIEWREDGSFNYSEAYKKYAISDVYEGILKEDKGPDESVHPDDVPIMHKFIQSIRNHERRVSATLRCKLKDGTYRWTEMLGFYEFDDNDNITRRVGILRDVENEWKEQNLRLQEALNMAKRANEAKTTFLATVSHDMRTPLNGILGITSLMKSRVTEKEMSDDLTQLDNSGRYLLNLINDILDVSKIESGKLMLQPQRCDSTSLVDSIMMLLKPNLDSKDLDFFAHMSPLSHRYICIDVGRVEQIIVNIVGNSIKFTPDGGRIDLFVEEIGVEDNKIRVKVTVEDNGIGMSKEFLPHIFEPFVQANQGSKTQYKGTGLGMSITKQIIELMGGQITVDSTLGMGTTVVFTLDMLIDENEDEDVFVEDQAIDTKQLIDKRVLLCEDHPLNAEIAQRLLEDKGMIVEWAEDGLEGFELFENSSNGYFDAILMDIRMPNLDGYETTKKIRSSRHPQAKTIPIIAMTANAFDADKEESIKSGMNAHLSKPIEPCLLFRTLLKYIN